MTDQLAQPGTIVRSLTLPILAPVEPSEDWSALRADLSAMFDACRRAANLIVSEIYAHSG